MLVKLWFKKYVLHLSSLFLVVVFLTVRTSYFLYYPAVRIARDSMGYLNLAEVIKSGVAPDFSIRTPGYPLFLALITSVFDQWMAVVVAQNLITLLAVLTLVYGVYRLQRPLAFPAALAMAGLVGGTQSLFYDIHLLTESLYTSCIIFSFAFFMLSFATRRALYFGLASTFMAVTIIIRPSGMYFLVIYALILFYLLWNKTEKRLVAGFLFPLPLLLFLLCAYNYFTFNKFTISVFGEVNLALATISFWEPDPTFPEEVNEAIKELPSLLSEKVKFGNKERFIRNTSWDPAILYPLFFKPYNAYFFDYAYGSRFSSSPPTPEKPSQSEYQEDLQARHQSGYVETNRELVRQVVFTSIGKHPDLYAKFVWANSVHYFMNITDHVDAYESHIQRINEYRQFLFEPSGNLYANMLAQEYADNVKENVVENSAIQSVRLVVQSAVWNIFYHEIWIWLYFFAFILSIAILATSRGRHDGAFILFILTVSVIGSCLIVSLVETSLPRYSFPSQFIYYLSTMLLPILKMKRI
jgi:hypothetical protein